MNELTAENLHLWRGDNPVLRGVSFQVAGGQCLQVTGDNGAGKTTLLRTLCGLVPLEEGRVLWEGREVRADREGFHAQLEYLGHDNGLKADLTAAENLRASVQLRHAVDATAISAALARTGMADAAQARLRRLSAGQRRRVALARLLLGAAPLWILDEPTSHLDHRGQELMSELLSQHLAHGGTAVVATHQPLGLPAARLLPLALQ